MTRFRSSKQVPSPTENNSITVQERELMSCIPSRASYSVNVTYSGGLRTITHSQNYLGSISDYIIPVEDYTPDQGHWSAPLLQTLTAFNDFAIIDAILTPLGGNYTMFSDLQFAIGASSYYTCGKCRLASSAIGMTDNEKGATGGTIVADTLLNTQRDNYTRSVADGPSFVLSDDILNEALFNTTMSAMFQFGYWNTTALTNVTNVLQLYSLAYPVTLIVPYLLCLVLSIPFLYLGLASLHSNGVSANSGGFVQILMTTMGSQAIEKAAAGGSLGGDENVPAELKTMKIRFGELVGTENRLQRRAGFGTEDEVVPLSRDGGRGLENLRAR